MSAASLLVATVEATPPRRVHVESREDAEWLSLVTGCRVRVIEETVYEPKAPAARPTNGAPLPEDPNLSAPEKIRKRMSAQPDRTFRAMDFPDIGDSAKVGNILHRLAEQQAIERVERGEYRSLRTAAPTPPAHTGPQVLAFLQQRPGEWLRPAQVTKDMGLPDDRRNAVTAALVRLARSGKLSKRGSTFCFLTRAARQQEVRP